LLDGDVEGSSMQRILRNLIALSALMLAGLTISPAAAHYSEPCWVKFRIDYPTSYRYRASYYSDAPQNVFSVTCNYLTGAELNGRAGYKRFDARRVYAVIVWPYSDPSYIRISQSLTLCGDVAAPDCAERIAGRLTGSDDYYDRRGRVFRRTWDICQPGFLDRDCYRMLGGYLD
jgi:hypothetical protein